MVTLDNDPAQASPPSTSDKSHGAGASDDPPAQHLAEEDDRDLHSYRSPSVVRPIGSGRAGSDSGVIVIWIQAKKLAHAALALGVVAGGIVLTQSAPASAASGNCNAKKDVEVRDWQPDGIRAIARCTHIAGGTEARGYLDMLGCCDKETTWFTTINKDYYSAYASGNFSSVGVNLRDI